MIYIFTSKNTLQYSTQAYPFLENIVRLGSVMNKKGVYKLLKGKGYKRTSELEQFVEGIQEDVVN